MIDLGSDARAIIEAGRDLDEPRDVDRARVRRALLTRIAAGGAATALASSAAAAPIMKLLLPLALVATAGVGGGLWWNAQHRASEVTSVSEKTSPQQAPLIAPLAADNEIPEAKPRARSAAAKARAVVSSPPSRLAEETALLAEVNGALRNGDAAHGLALLNDYDKRFPAGVLREEMLATRIIARCQATPGARAQEAARRFLAQYPASPMAPRVRSSCAGLDR